MRERTYGVSNVRRLANVAGAALILIGIAAGTAGGATTLPVLWTAGGLSAGTDSAGQAARVAVDPSGNLAVVSGPSLGRDLAITAYSATGSLRWRRAVSPSIGTFVGDWVAAAPNGDFVAVGRNTDSRGNPIAITLVRYASDGTLRWRIDLARTRPGVARLLVDAGGNAYLAFNSVGDGQDIQVHKYSSAGVLLWSQAVSTGFLANDIATSLALSPDGADVVLSGNVAGGAVWITAAYNAATGARRWLVTAPEGVAARDIVVDATRVYVTGQGNVGISSFLTVVAYARATGARLWRTDAKPAGAGGAAGLWMDLAPDGSVVVAGQASRGFLDWYTVTLETSGAIRWETIRDGGLNTDEIPRGVLALADGTVVVTGRGGPNLPGGFIQGVTAGYGAAGALLWEGFSRMETVWAFCGRSRSFVACACGDCRESAGAFRDLMRDDGGMPRCLFYQHLGRRACSPTCAASWCLICGVRRKTQLTPVSRSAMSRRAPGVSRLPASSRAADLSGALAAMVGGVPGRRRART